MQRDLLGCWADPGEGDRGMKEIGRLQRHLTCKSDQRGAGRAEAGSLEEGPPGCGHLRLRVAMHDHTGLND